jgi:membrane-associated phospholipid phosphatase
MIQSLLMVPPIVTLSYLAASLDRPVVDDFLAQADRFIGFDWTWVSIWMSSHPWLAATLTFTYTTIVWQPFLIMFLGSVNRPGYANSEFIWGFLLSALLTIAISGIVPAFGYEGVIGSPHINTLHAVREGAWTMLDIDRIDGIITFPSFHAAAGILFLYSVRHIRWALCILAPLNIAMILSTPTVGGHYLVDVIAGMVIASFSITLAGRLGARTTPRNMGWSAADGTGARALGRSRQATESSGMSA